MSFSHQIYFHFLLHAAVLNSVSEASASWKPRRSARISNPRKDRQSTLENDQNSQPTTASLSGGT